MAVPVTLVDRSGAPVSFVPAEGFSGRYSILAQGAIAVSHTGDTIETVLATTVIPGGSMGPTGALRVDFSGLVTNNANVKTVRVRLGGLTGDVLAVGAFTTVGTFSFRSNIFNRNASQQHASTYRSRNTDTVIIHEVASGTIDTSVDQNIVATAELANAADTITLDNARVELLVP